jgi:hypothetical protein
MTNQTLSGTVQSGGSADARPLAGARVTLYEATPDGARRLGTASTGADGRFSIDAHAAAGEGVLYATAAAGENILLAVVIGREMRGAVTINEMTTVSAAFSMAQFTDGSKVRGDAFGLRIAAAMSENLASPRTGEPSDVLLAPPNADETIALRSTRALGNLLAPCVRGRPGAWERLREIATPPRGHAPADTFQALANIVHHPAHNVDEIHHAAKEMEIYQPALERKPDAWTLAVKVNRTGGVGKRSMFGGPANVAFDRNGYAWIANNVFQGTPNSCDFSVVLRPDGKPADGTGGEPVSPVMGGGVVGPGWGIDIDSRGHVWVGSFGWGPSDTFPTEGIASEYDPSGRPLSGDGYMAGLQRVQAVEADADDNIWLASFGDDTITVYPKGDPKRAASYPDPARKDEKAPGSCTFGIAINPDGTAWVSYCGGLGWPQANPGHVARFRLEDGRLHCIHHLRVGKVTKALASDSRGNAWVPGGGDDTVYLVTPDGHQTGFSGGGVIGPWGIAIDGDDEVWVANFGHMGITENFTDGRISKLAGIRSPSGLSAGTPLTPETGYSLPSAGAPVTLPDGSPLYDHGEPCHSPLMRSTGVQIDAAGNVWAVNNWKPRFGTDFPPAHGNPGGDGIVIFVGLAKPPRRRS